MAGLMGMNRYFADSGLKGMSQSASLQTQRENNDTQMAAAHDSTVKGTTASMAGSGAMLGYAAAPTVAGMMAPAAATTLEGAGLATSMLGTGLTQAGIAGGTAAAGTAAAGTAAAGAGAAAGTTAATTAAATTGAAIAGAETGTTVGSFAGPIGAVAGLAVGALAGWLFSEFG